MDGLGGGGENFFNFLFIGKKKIPLSGTAEKFSFPFPPKFDELLLSDVEE